MSGRTRLKTDPTASRGTGARPAACDQSSGSARPSATPHHADPFNCTTAPSSAATSRLASAGGMAGTIRANLGNPDRSLPHPIPRNTADPLKTVKNNKSLATKAGEGADRWTHGQTRPKSLCVLCDAVWRRDRQRHHLEHTRDSRHGTRSLASLLPIRMVQYTSEPFRNAGEAREATSLPLSREPVAWALSRPQTPLAERRVGRSISIALVRVVVAVIFVSIVVVSVVVSIAPTVPVAVVVKAMAVDIVPTVVAVSYEGGVEGEGGAAEGARVRAVRPRVCQTPRSRPACCSSHALGRTRGS